MKQILLALVSVVPFFSNASASDVVPFSAGLNLIANRQAVAKFCPTNDLLVVKGTSKYTEGGSTTWAGFELTQIAKNVTFVESKDRSVTWGADLIAKYSKCEGVAFLEGSDARDSIFVLEFSKGQVFFTLTVEPFVTREGDELGVIQYQDIKNGIPVFRYAFAD